MVYRLFKREVFDRRERMMGLARRGSLIFFLLILFNLTFLPREPLTRPSGLLLPIGIVLLTILWISQIHQQKTRHREAKEQLIRLEAIVGLFSGSGSHDGESLLPESWQSPRKRDAAFAVDIGVLILTALAALLSIFLS